MTRRPSDITQAEIRRLVAGAKAAGASEVRLQRGETVLTIKLSPSSTSLDLPGDLAPERESVL